MADLALNLQYRILLEQKYIHVQKLYADAIIPKRATQLASGFDLHAYDVIPARMFADKVSTDPNFVSHSFEPGERVLVRTGIAMEIPEGWEAQIRPRSGLALKYGIAVVNSPGTIDADYRGEIGVVLLNAGHGYMPIDKGDRIAQLVICPVSHDAELVEVDELSPADRGEGGFGHTGGGV